VRTLSLSAAVAVVSGGLLQPVRGSAGRRRAFLGMGGGVAPLLRALLHSSRALLGDDDVALFDAARSSTDFSASTQVWLRPCRRRRVELGADLKALRQRCVSLPLIETAWLMSSPGFGSEQRRFRGRAKRLQVRSSS